MNRSTKLPLPFGATLPYNQCGLNVASLPEELFIPTRNADELASGWDVRANITDAITLVPNSSYAFPIGIAFDFMPMNQMILDMSNNLLELDVQIRPKSSLSERNIYVMIGTIDADWHGESKCHMINLSQVSVTISPGQKIGQMVFGTRVNSDFINLIPASMDSFTPTNRDKKGFGSSGQF